VFLAIRAVRFCFLAELGILHVIVVYVLAVRGLVRGIERKRLWSVRKAVKSLWLLLTVYLVAA